MGAEDSARRQTTVGRGYNGRARRPLVVAWMAMLALVGCKKVDPVPEDLDGVMHFLWLNYDDGTDEALHEAVVNLDKAVKGKSLEEAFDGSLTRLDAEEAEVVGVVDRNPKDAAGIFLGNVVHCDWQTMTRILTHPHQDQLYTGVYDDYTRVYDGDIEAFRDQSDDDLAWDLDYTASVLGATYTAGALGVIRRIPAIDDEISPFGPIYLARAHMPRPANFEGDSNKYMRQDYQLEIYWSRRGGEILHAYAMWREASWGTGFTSEDDSVQRILLNNLEGWDKDTDKICEDGGP